MRATRRTVDRKRRAGAVVGLGVGDVHLGGLAEQMVPAERPHLGASLRRARAHRVVAQVIRLGVLQLEDVVTCGVGATERPALALDRLVTCTRVSAAQIAETLIHANKLKCTEVVTGADTVADFGRFTAGWNVVETMRLARIGNIQRALGILRANAPQAVAVVFDGGGARSIGTV